MPQKRMIYFIYHLITSSQSDQGDVIMEQMNCSYSKRVVAAANVNISQETLGKWYSLQTKSSMSSSDLCSPPNDFLLEFVCVQASRRFVSRLEDQHRCQSQRFHHRHDAEQPWPREGYSPGSHVIKSRHFQQLCSVKLPVRHANVLQTSPRWEAGFQTHVPPQPGQGPTGQLDSGDRQDKHICQGLC